jgi:multidrug efflux pump subunit AcrA (membrane-fusion protein)
VAQAQTRQLQRTVPVAGTLYPYEDVMLAPKVSGRVLRTFKDLGDRVGPGELLLELDPTEYRIAVEQARPALQGELRRLKLATLPTSDAEFEAHLPRVDAVVEARANATLAKSQLEVAKKEFAATVNTEQALQVAQNRVTVADIRVLAAETEARVSFQNARRLKAALDDAERRQADTRLYAPTPPEWNEWIKQLGKTDTPLTYAVAQMTVGVGSSVESMPVTNCYRLVLDHALKFGVAVPEKHKPEVLPGQPVKLRVQAYPGETFDGFVARISPTTDAASRTFGVVVGVRNGVRKVDRKTGHDLGGKLDAGGFATGEILTRTEQVVTVPPEALVSFAGVNKVFVLTGDRAKAVEVKVGTRDKDWLEVGGLEPGAKVVTSGQSQLVDGAAVRVR